MPSIQELIHKFEEGEGARQIKIVAVILGLFALTAIYNLREFRNFLAPEAMEAAQLGRNIAEGKGFNTGVIRPLGIYMLEKQKGAMGANVYKDAFPDITNPPLYPVVLAGLMKVLPFDYSIDATQQFSRHQPDFLIALFNECFLFLAVWLTFRLARRLFDNAVAWMAAIVMLGSDLLWRFSMSGLPTMMLICLLLAIVSRMVRMEQAVREESEPEGAKKSQAWFLGGAVFIGILLGLGALTRYSFAFLVLPVTVYFLLFMGQRRFATVLLLLLAFGVLLAPWLVRNYNVCGHWFGTSSYAIFQDSMIYPGNALERSLRPNPITIEGIHFGEVARKFLVNANHIMQHDLPRMGGSWLSAFFLAGLLVPFRNASLSRLRVFVLTCLPVLIVAQALGKTWLAGMSPDINSENLLVFLSPLVFCFGAALFFMLLDQLELPFPQARAWIIALSGVLACAPMGFSFLPPKTPTLSYPPYYPWLIQHTSNFMKDKELIMSDMPWAVAWYGRRNSVWLTLTPQEDFLAINDFQQPVKGLFLTHLTLDQRFLTGLVKGDDFKWGRFVLDITSAGKAPPGFPLSYAWSGALPYSLFMSDWERWTAPKRTQ